MIRRHDAPWRVENDKSFVAEFGQAMEKEGDTDEPSDERTEDRGRSAVKTRLKSSKIDMRVIRRAYFGFHLVAFYSYLRLC